ncbi:MAG: pyridoxal phosphate-dependent aminotransferase [Acidimicrobiia bacterium]
MNRSGIREFFDLANRIPDAIHLEMGEPDFATPEHIRDAAARAANDGYTRYTPNAGIPQLREAIARKLEARNGIDASPDQVVVTPGAIAALYGTVMALCDPGDEILISDPAWPNYAMLAGLQGVGVVRYPMLPEHRMQPKAEQIEPLITDRTKILLINSPCNPTGTVIDQRHLEDLLDLADTHNLWVLSDEVYDEIVFDSDTVKSPAAQDKAGRVVSVFSFSKTYAMTGWRVGYAVAPPELAPYLVKIQEPVTACVNAPAQMAAVAALEGPQDCVTEMRDAYEKRRDGVVEILGQAGVPFIRPAGAFYLWINIAGSDMGSNDFARVLLEGHHVAVTPGRAFGPAGEDFVRVSLASKTEELNEGTTRLVHLLHARSG